MTFRRFLRTPKGLVLVVLILLVLVAATAEPLKRILPALAGAIAAAVIVDVPVLRRRLRRWAFPDGAVITALIVAMVLSPEEPWYVVAVTSAAAVLSKYVFRTAKANVFNPAAFGLVATFYVFDTGQSWWGALPEMFPAAVIVLFATGILIAWRLRKLPVVLAFLGGYFALATAAAFVGPPARVAELFRSPDLHAALYFAFFMVTDPPTSPPRAGDQLVYGGLVAVTAFAMFELVGAAWFLLAGVLVANLWEARRRMLAAA